MQLIGGALVLKVMQARWVYVIVLALIAGALLAVYVGLPRHPAGPTRGVPTVGIVGQDPSAMAVDERTARVYVANKLADHEPRPVVVGRSEWQRLVHLLPFWRPSPIGSHTGERQRRVGCRLMPAHDALRPAVRNH